MAIYDNYLPTKDAGNGVTTDFSFSWDMIEEMYSRVYLEEVATGILTLQTLYTDYTLTLNETGGIVSFVSAPSSDYNIIISREVPLEQIVPFTTSSGFNAKVIEDALDKTTGMIQDLGDSISRTILLPVGSSLTNVSLPQPTAKRCLIWNDTEDGLENTLYNPDEQVLIASARATSASASATSASASATSASTSADLSESWAIDDIGDRPEGSSKYWAEQSELSVTGKANTDLSNLSVIGLDAILPVGAIIPLARTSAPANSRLIYCNGASVSRTLYSKLFDIIGTSFGVGDNSTTFNLPDYRGKFLRGLGGNSESDFATTQGDAIRNITGTFATDAKTTTNTGAFTMDGSTVAAVASAGGLDTTAYKNYFNASNVVPTAVENRPINQAVNYFIKY